MSCVPTGLFSLKYLLLIQNILINYLSIIYQLFPDPPHLLIHQCYAFFLFWKQTRKPELKIRKITNKSQSTHTTHKNTQSETIIYKKKISKTKTTKEKQYETKNIKTSLSSFSFGHLLQAIVLILICG